MTVCVAVKVHDCIVFAADSATTLVTTFPDGRQEVAKVYEHADKVFKVCRDLPIAAMTCGMGHIGDRSISNLAKQLRSELTKGPNRLDPENYSIEEVAKRAHTFFGERYQEARPTANSSDYLEFWVAGYGSAMTTGEAWKIVIRAGVLEDLEEVFRPDQTQGLAWGGQIEAIHRLVFGIDPSFHAVAKGAGVRFGAKHLLP